MHHVSFHVAYCLLLHVLFFYIVIVYDFFGSCSVGIALFTLFVFLCCDNVVFRERLPFHLCSCCFLIVTCVVCVAYSFIISL